MFMPKKIVLDASQRKNRGMILGLIRKNGPISRKHLGELSNLNKATVSTIVRDLLESGVIRQTGSIDRGDGRRTVGLALHMDRFVCIVLQITKDHIKSGILTLHQDLCNFRQIRYLDSFSIETIVQQLFQEIEIQIAYCAENRYKILGISLASLGYLIVENDSYEIHADGFRTLSETDFHRRIQERYPGYCVLMNHDANASAFAELESYVKEGNPTPSVLLNIVGDIGLGGGIIIDGHILRGHHGIAGEIGHMGIHGADVGESAYRRSTYEEYSSPYAVRRMVRDDAQDYEGTCLTPDASLEEIYDAYEAGDPLAGYAMNRSARYMAYGLAGLAYVLDPEVIILGDKITTSGKYRETVHRYLEEFLPRVMRSRIRLRFSEFKQDSALIGAGIILFDTVMEDGSIIGYINEYNEEAEIFTGNK